MIRLDKYLSDLGFGTRKEVKKIIKLGYTTINGVVELRNDFKFDEDSAIICVDGEKQNYRKMIYLMMNKPGNVITATFDPFERDRTVLDLLPPEFGGCFPVGRLDKDTVGLLLLTNDGQFAHRMSAPKRGIAKAYYAIVTGKALAESDFTAFERGIRFEDESYLPAKLFTVENYATIKQSPEITALCRKSVSGSFSFDNEVCEAIVEITEGKFHQVKNMFKSVGKTVLFLKRISHGKFVLPPELKEGDFVELNLNLEV